MSYKRPVVLSFSGHDPCGGAGVQADIETLISHQCHAVSVITALTEQDTKNVKKIIPQLPGDIISQADTLFNDLDIQAIKIGLIGHLDTAQAIHNILLRYPDIPVILDPVLAAGGGTSLANEPLIDAIVDLLLPCTTVLTPNSHEARLLAGMDDIEEAALTLLDEGSEYVLVTGSHEDTPSVCNQLYADNECIERFNWDRLPDNYHGSGCTLASSITALIAHGLTPVTAIKEAQEYTWNALKNAYHSGKGQHIPNRLFWIEETT